MLDAPKIGFDEGEQREFNRVVTEQLLVQTPLQVLLEMLYSRLQAQASMFTELQRRVERQETRDLGTAELLRRLQLCESKLHDIGVSKLSPFKQQEVLGRLEALEDGAGGGQSQASLESELQRVEAMEGRLEAVEGRVAGVYNLSGKLIALEQIAETFGIDIPDLEYSPGLDTAAFFAQGRQQVSEAHASAAAAAAAAAAAGASLLPAGSVRHRSPDGRALSPERSSGLSTSGVPRLGDVAVQVRVLAEENEALRETVEELSATLAATGASVAAHGMRLDALDAGSSELRSKVATNATNVSTLASRKAAEVNFADFSLLTARVVAGEAVAAGAARAASEAGLQVAALRGAVEMLSEGGGGSTGAGGARTMGAFDALFHTRLASVEGSVKAVRGELRAAVVELGGSCASVAQLDEVAAAVATRARQADIQTLATQQAALATSINGMAEWLAMRPETADGAKGTGGSATKFKCLTCDREIQSQGTPNGRDAAAKGLVLPRLDGMHGTTSMPSGPGTVRLKSPARGAEYEVGAWTTASVPMAVESSLGEMGGSGVGALGSPVRASRAHVSGRAAVGAGGTVGGCHLKSHIAGPTSTPVFL